MEKKWLGILCVIYAVLIIYGSLMPFDIHWDSDQAAWRFERGLGFWPVSDELHTSKVDLFSNFLLYIPLGLLLATRSRVGESFRFWAVACGCFAAAGVSVTVEAVQLFSASRISSVSDLVSNTAGGLAGGVLGAWFGRAGWAGGERVIRRWRRDRPMALVCAAVVILLACDAVFPFLPTLDVSSVVRNLRASNFSPAGGLALHPWHHWLVRRVGIYAVLAVVTGSAYGPKRRRWLQAAAWTVCIAVVLEAVKPFIQGRCANAANVVTSACGAVIGAALGWLFSGRLSARGAAMLAAGLLGGYVIYVEWEPFNFAWNIEAASAKLPHGASWLPLYSYAMRGKMDDVYLFVRTIALLASLVYAARLANGRGSARRAWASVARWVLLAAVMGLVLELGQFALPGRFPSTTDVFCFAVGGLLGAIAPALPAKKNITEIEK